MHSVLQNGSLDFPELTERVGQWSEQQFGEQPSIFDAKGAIEEVGELIHSDLKRDQGIREDDDAVGPQAEQDAVADVIIYLADLAYREDLEITLHDAIGHRETKDGALVETIDALKHIYDMLEEGTAHEMTLTFEIRQVIAHLRRFCQIKGYDLDVNVASTWTEVVSEREWDADVTGGETHADD